MAEAPDCYWMRYINGETGARNLEPGIRQSEFVSPLPGLAVILRPRPPPAEVATVVEVASEAVVAAVFAGFADFEVVFGQRHLPALLCEVASTLRSKATAEDGSLRSTSRQTGRGNDYSSHVTSSQFRIKIGRGSVRGNTLPDKSD